MLPVGYATHANAAIRIAIADDNFIFCDGLELLLKKQPHFTVVGRAENGHELMHLVDLQKPDVVIMDTAIQRLDSFRAMKMIKTQHPGIGVIAISATEDENLLTDMIEAGARGFMIKHTIREEMEQAIKTVYNNGYYYCTTTSGKVLCRLTKSNGQLLQKSPQVHFTEREVKIIQLLCHEQTSKEISSQLGINRRCVETTRERILQKIGARNMVGIVVYAIKNGLFNIS